MLWFSIGLPAVYLGIGALIAGQVHNAGPPISLRSWLYLMRAWPRVLFLDALDAGGSRKTRKETRRR
jgi:hypothetical protein